MRIKTSELEGAALDWAVATAIDAGVLFEDWAGPDPWVVLSDYNALEWVPFAPSTDWSQGGPLIEKYRKYPDRYHDDCLDVTDEERFFCPVTDTFDINTYQHGPTPLIAACRAIVAAKLGDEVEVPDELL